MPPMPSCHNRVAADPGEPPRPSHISKMVLSTVKIGLLARNRAVDTLGRLA